MDLSIDYDPSSPNYLDLVFRDGDLVATSDVDPTGTNAVLQNCQQELRAFKGEWFLDLTDGIPWFQTIARKGTTRAERESIIRGALLGAAGVTRLNAFSTAVDAATRTMKVNFNVSSAQGSVVATTKVEYTGGIYP